MINTPNRSGSIFITIGIVLIATSYLFNSFLSISQEGIQKTNSEIGLIFCATSALLFIIFGVYLNVRVKK